MASAEQRMERFARLEIDGPVLHLHQHVVVEFSVERHELAVGLACAIVRRFVRVDECTPHDDPSFADGICEHVGAVGVGAAVVLWTWLAF
jgi:hypothetical protein